MIRFSFRNRDRLKATLAAFFCAFLTPAPAFADIALSPLRQVLAADRGEATFSILNPSTRILHGRVTWIDLTATETGYAPADAGARTRFSAAPYLTLSPAQFRLEPGARITVTVALKDGQTPPPGERRSHLLIETAAARTAIRKASNGGLEVDIGAGVSAPVLLRGAGRAAAAIGETKLLRDSEGMLLISTTIKPKGEISTFGRIVASFKPADSSEPEKILGIRANIAGFVDAEMRRIEIPFGFFSLGPGTLTLRYEGQAEYEGRVFDKREFDIAPPG